MSVRRRRAEARGRWAERLAMVWLVLKGYRLLDHRARTAAGEIDLVARKGEYLVFVEVKARGDAETARASIGTRQRRRIERAAMLWKARNRAFSSLFPRYDLILVVPGRWPVHERAAWVPPDASLDYL